MRCATSLSSSTRNRIRSAQLHQITHEVFQITIIDALCGERGHRRSLFANDFTEILFRVHLYALRHLHDLDRERIFVLLETADAATI